LRRPRQASSCTDTQAAAQTINDAHRDAAHCLRIASMSSPARLKAALLAQAQVLQRAHAQQAQPELTQVASTFADRWVMREASLR
jgi:hypothetical protein